MAKKNSKHRKVFFWHLNTTKSIDLVLFGPAHRPVGVFLIIPVIIASFWIPGYAIAQRNLPIGDTAAAPGRMGTQNYYVEPGSFGTKRESDPPEYVRSVSIASIKGVEKISWLEVGLDYRTRLEVRKNDLRRPRLTTDYPLLLRSRAYLGVKNIIDPLRLAIEFEDAYRVNGKFPKDNRDFNRAEIIQAYGELYFKNALGRDALGNNRPVSLRFGRQSFEFLDRRLIALNQWRNTTNNFMGFRAAIGQDKNDWQIDLLALRPIIRIIDEFDKTDRHVEFWAIIGHWRKWSDAITIEPYYLGLRQSPSVANNDRERHIHSPGLRMYGWSENHHFNYDITGTLQFGKDSGLNHQAHAMTVEVGYKRKELNGKPGISLFYGYASGDKDPADNVSNRFERFFGFARPWSSDDYIVYENIVTPKVKIEFEPLPGVRIDGGYSFYWLASATDRFNNLLGGSNNRDLTGNSGQFIGHGLDARLRFKPAKFIAANIGYTHFTNGEFVLNMQKAALEKNVTHSDFAYIEMAFNAFDLFK